MPSCGRRVLRTCTKYARRVAAARSSRVRGGRQRAKENSVCLVPGWGRWGAAARARCGIDHVAACGRWPWYPAIPALTMTCVGLERERNESKGLLALLCAWFWFHVCAGIATAVPCRITSPNLEITSRVCANSGRASDILWAASECSQSSPSTPSLFAVRILLFALMAASTLSQVCAIGASPRESCEAGSSCQALRTDPTPESKSRSKRSLTSYRMHATLSSTPAPDLTRAGVGMPAARRPNSQEDSSHHYER